MTDDPLLNAFLEEGIVVDQCPNVMPGATCVDPECTYCKIARAEAPRGHYIGLDKNAP